LRKWKLENSDKSLVYMYVASSLSPYVMNAQRQEEESSLVKRIWGRAIAWTKQFISIAAVIDLYETAIRLDRGNMEAYVRLAQFYEAGELFDDAMKTLRKALKYEWNAEAARQLVMLLVNADNSKLRTEAKEWIERLLEEQSNDLSMLELKALLLLDDGQEEEAERLLLSLIETEPLLHRSILALGTLYNGKQRYNEAIHVLTSGLCHHPNDPELMRELARAYDESGQTERALAVVDEWLCFDEMDLTAHYQRACYLAKLGRMEEAEAELAYVLDEDETGYFSELAKEERAFASFMRP
jgi:tetratricopeptide (TPR) repeat protein